MAAKYQDTLNELSELQEAHKEVQEKLEETTTQLNSEKQKYEILIDESSHIEKTLNAKIESLIAEKDFTSKRLEGVLNKIEKNNIILSNETETTQAIENSRLNGEATSDVDEVKDEIFIKTEKISNGMPETTNGHNHFNENGQEKSDFKGVLFSAIEKF